MKHQNCDTCAIWERRPSPEGRELKRLRLRDWADDVSPLTRGARIETFLLSLLLRAEKSPLTRGARIETNVYSS